MAEKKIEDIISVLEMMAYDVRYLESFPCGRWLVRQEQEDPEWIKTWQGAYKEALIAAVDVLKELA